jgi:hypothetical protein
MNIISFKFAIKAMLILLSLVIVFHLLVLIHIIPSNIVWGGKFQNVAQMRNFETLSIIINAIMIFIIALKGQYIKLNIPGIITNSILWLFVLLFALNTIGNLFAKTYTETIIFTPISFISAILCYRIAVTGKRIKE